MHPQPPPPAVMMQMLVGRWTSHALGAAAKFRYADHLAGGPKSADELAKLTGTHGPSVFRLLRALASLGVFSETEPGTFANTPLSETLRNDVPGSMAAMALFLNHPVHIQAWTELPYGVKTGESAFEHAHQAKPWDYLARHPDVAPVFNDAMTAFSAMVGGAVVEAYDFSGIGTLVDVGGGHGGLLTGILQKNPSLRGVLFDLPPTVGDAARALVERSGTADRCQIVGGDFFESVPSGDAFVLKAIIHDWSDVDSIRILKNVHRASKPGAKVLLVEAPIRPGNDPDLGKLVDLEMLIMTNGGRERTDKEYVALFEASGFALARVIPTRSPVAIIEAIRK
jgi:SAM-dependent methyltransferase